LDLAKNDDRSVPMIGHGVWVLAFARTTIEGGAPPRSTDRE
jgi:hypothetical protein